MSRLDRYVLFQLLGPMGFFALVFVGLIWITQSLRIVEIVVRNNQSGLVFLELSALLLPGVIATIIPLAALAATIFVINRLYGESELVVMMAAGRSNIALARPVLAFGVLMMLASGALTTTLSPMATEELRQRTADLRAEVTNALLQGGRFINPQQGITVFVREASRDGTMLDVFIHDQRSREERVTYTAQQARLVRSGEAAQIVMVNGTTQTYDTANRTLTVLDFERVIYDLGVIVRPTDNRRRNPTEFPAWENVAMDLETFDQNPRRFGSFIAEGHDQFSAPLYALVLPLIALAGLLSGSYRRLGLAARIAAVIFVAVLGRIAGFSAKAQVTGNADLWPLLYAVPIALGLAATLVLLGSGVTRRMVRRTAVPEAG
ncbi:MAG: LptF/LptG family permease [Pseudomonadota bacterium]